MSGLSLYFQQRGDKRSARIITRSISTQKSLTRPDFTEISLFALVIGGSTNFGFTLYTFLKSLSVPIQAVNAGNIESMGIELDGKIKDEVFEHGSFLQSKMFDKGVRCSNCHNPHSTELKASGNAVCVQCHNTAGKTSIAVDGKGLQSRNYDSPEHHNHPMGQPGSQCVATRV